MQIFQTLPFNYWSDAEKYWIKYFKEQGCRLTNSTSGGEGVWGLKMSSSAKGLMSEKASKRWSSEEERKNKLNALLVKRQLKKQ